MNLPDILPEVHFDHDNSPETSRLFYDQSFRDGPQGLQNQQGSTAPGLPGVFDRDPRGTCGDAESYHQGVGIRNRVFIKISKGFHRCSDFFPEAGLIAGDYIRVGGDVTVRPVGGGCLANQMLSADGQERWNRSVPVFERSKRRIPIRQTAFHDLGNFQTVYIYGFPGHGDLLVGGDKHRASVLFGQIERPYGQQAAVLYIHRCENDHRQSAAVAPLQKLDVSVSPLGGRTGGGPKPLHIDDDHGDFAADGKGELFTVQADPGARRGGHGFHAGHGGSQAVADRGDLILPLEADPTGRRQESEHGVVDGGGRSDRVTRKEVAAGGFCPPRDRFVAFH